jgi:hypothetical protein
MNGETVPLLRRIAEGVDKLVAAIPKPESRMIMKILGIVATAAGAAGIIAVADTILGWFKLRRRKYAALFGNPIDSHFHYPFLRQKLPQKTRFLKTRAHKRLTPFHVIESGNSLRRCLKGTRTLRASAPPLCTKPS